MTGHDHTRTVSEKKEEKEKKGGGGGVGGGDSSKNSPHLSVAFLSFSLVVHLCLRTTESLGGDWWKISGNFKIPGYELGGDRTGQNLTRHTETVFDF